MDYCNLPHYGRACSFISVSQAVMNGSHASPLLQLCSTAAAGPAPRPSHRIWASSLQGSLLVVDCGGVAGVLVLRGKQKGASLVATAEQNLKHRTGEKARWTVVLVKSHVGWWLDSWITKSGSSDHGVDKACACRSTACISSNRCLSCAGAIPGVKVLPGLQARDAPAVGFPCTRPLGSGIFATVLR